MNPTLLLDLDGVLVPVQAWKPVVLEIDGFLRFQAEAAALLADLYHRTQFEVVLVSSHRSRYTPQAWQEVFAARGLSFHEITCLPAPQSHRVQRLDEICAWHATAAPCNWALLDDDAGLAALPEALRSRWVRPQAWRGVSAADIHALERVWRMEETGADVS